MATLELCGVGKTFANGVEAVCDVNVTVADGELFVIVGPSGCGKSTVLRMVAGLDEVSTGDVLIDGVRVNELTPQQRDIAMAFQHYALYPHMTVAENIGFALKVAQRHVDEIERRVADVARMLDLADVLERTPRTLSGGQQQRVAMGRAIIRSPRMLLMDEPMSNLDAQLRIAGRSELLNIHRRVLTTTMYVTHDQVEAMALGDRVAVMRAGRLVQCASPTEVYARPANVFVARFMGSPPMNLLAAAVVLDESRVVLEVGVHRLVLDGTALARSARLREFAGRRIAVGIRPESLHRDGDGPLVVSTQSVESLGPDQLVHATIDAASVDDHGDQIVVGPPRRTSISVRLPADDDVNLWAPLRLGVDLDALHYFDLTTGLPIS